MATELKHIDNCKISTADLMNGYEYQPYLTAKLDKIERALTQDIVNEIVFWKVNRFAQLDEPILSKINSISKGQSEVDPDLTGDILRVLLDKKTKGIGLPVASTILRFVNPFCYQILDQRVYRFVYSGQSLKIPSKIEQQIDLYLQYLKRLRLVCNQYNIEFKISDRILYQADRKLNQDHKLSGY